MTPADTDRGKAPSPQTTPGNPQANRENMPTTNASPSTNENAAPRPAPGADPLGPLTSRQRRHRNESIEATLESEYLHEQLARHKIEARDFQTEMDARRSEKNAEQARREMEEEHRRRQERASSSAFQLRRSRNQLADQRAPVIRESVGNIAGMGPGPTIAEGEDARTQSSLHERPRSLVQEPGEQARQRNEVVRETFGDALVRSGPGPAVDAGDENRPVVGTDRAL